MKQMIIFLLLLFSFLGCATNQSNQPKQKVELSVSTQQPISTIAPQTTKLSVPDWFISLPDGDIEAIGIAHDKLFKEEETKQLAKEHAAVLLSRCHGSFNVNKRATFTNDADAMGSDEQSAQFEVIVSSDLNYLKQVADSLKICDHFRLHNYYISLLGNKTGSFKPSMVEISDDSLPVWCKQNAIQTKDTEVYSLGVGKSEDLISAWDKAYDAALKQLAGYKQTQVSSVTQETYDNQSKSVALETSTVLGNVKPLNHYVTCQTKEGLTTYQVWCRLKYHME